MPQPSFSDGSLPLTADAIQGEIRRARSVVDRQLFVSCKAAEPELDQLTIDMCDDERRQGNRLPQWLLDAELAAYQRLRARRAA